MHICEPYLATFEERSSLFNVAAQDWDDLSPLKQFNLGDFTRNSVKTS